MEKTHGKKIKYIIIEVQPDEIGKLKRIGYKEWITDEIWNKIKNRHKLKGNTTQYKGKIKEIWRLCRKIKEK